MLLLLRSTIIKQFRSSKVPELRLQKVEKVYLQVNSLIIEN